MSEIKLTKYEHACLILEKNGKKSIIDPGSFSKLPDKLEDVTCLIITEEHTDHFNLDNVKRIVSQNPEIEIYTTKVVHDELAKESIRSTAIEGDISISCAGFSYSFYETDHAPIHGKSPCKSLPVKVDDYLFYPSDTYKTIPDAVQILALPTSGPWHKLTEAIDQANAIKSPTILTTHNALYNEQGHGVANHFIEMHIADKNRKLVHLNVGESL